MVSYAGNGTVYTLQAGGAARRADAARAEPAVAAARAHRVLPVGDWRLQRDAQGALLPRTHHYLAPDGRTFVSATQAFVDGAMSWGVKSSDLIRAFGLQRGAAGRARLPDQRGRSGHVVGAVGDDGGLSDLRLFVHQGGEGVATDAEGNVYIAAGDVYVYDPAGTLIDTIRVPERPTQLVFGGPDRDALHPARHALYAVRTRVPGR